MAAWRRKPLWVRAATALAALVAVLLPVLVLARLFLLGFYEIPSESMEPTLGVGSHVVTNRLAHPARGGVFTLHPPAAATLGVVGKGPDGLCGAAPGPRQACATPVDERSDETFVKRLVAGPGDRVAIVGDRVVLNGKPLAEPYVKTDCVGGVPADFPRPIRVPAGHWFALGDNRRCSQDSRFWGPVPADWVLGRVIGH